ncbi:NAD(P)/FAD-dependent oxidoreductase [Cellulomonas sp. KRMCY2]|uniref:phytoene desaturase family protein n=1 Tax=Cellulomonas sp. KRMCY2 TaxID=1304865 RepID=UPI00045EC00F|nr:NAD(P)/FAD-dependent oxidoreductase [Cellulomonas sp. KRMCY2]
MTAAVDRTAIAPRYDVVVVGGGHNGLTAAAYLARAGRTVLLLEQADRLGGATQSVRPFAGRDARLSRYSYLVSLMPRAVRDELGLDLTLVRRRIASYTPLPADPTRGLLVDPGDDEVTAQSFVGVGAGSDASSWRTFGARTRRLAQGLFPTMTDPLPTPDRVRELVGSSWWRDLVQAPLGELVEATFDSDLVRGVVLTDALIGTFARAHDPSLIQNRCFLYHVIGGGTGDWDVPVGGMGAVLSALEDAARAAGAQLRTSARVTGIDPDSPAVTFDDDGVMRTVGARHVLAGCSPRELERLLGRTPGEPGPEGAQLKVNMLLTRLPRLHDAAVRPQDAFAGTFHVNEGYDQLERAYAQAAVGTVPTTPPLEIYCHSLTDPSILGADLQRSGHHTLTLFGLHMPARLFRSDPDATRDHALAATLASLDSVLAEPIEDCLALDADGRPCLEVRTPVDLEIDVGLPGGHIFHRDLSWPWAEPSGGSDHPAARWGVATEHPAVLLCGAGARRGGGVSGIPGRSAAMAVLAT